MPCATLMREKPIEFGMASIGVKSTCWRVKLVAELVEEMMEDNPEDKVEMEKMIFWKVVVELVYENRAIFSDLEHSSILRIPFIEGL